MTLKALSLSILFFSLFGMASAATQAPSQTKPAPYNDHPAFNLHDEIDKTDTYAIQLDSSEEEQNEELESLEEGYPPKK